MSHHYDAHDHDRLLRWRDDLRSAPAAASDLPAMVLFPVKPQATSSHEIFRRYRAEFGQRNAPFANLVIFGTHGVSDTVRNLLAQTALSEPDLPVMLLVVYLHCIDGFRWVVFPCRHPLESRQCRYPHGQDAEQAGSRGPMRTGQARTTGAAHARRSSAQ